MLLFPLCNQALLVASKFLEVWDDFGTEAKTSERVLELRRAVGPYVKRLEVWKGLRKYRNTVLAHPYLRDGKVIHPRELLAAERAPQGFPEALLLLECVREVVAWVLTAFRAEYMGIRPLLVGSEYPRPTAGPGIGGFSEVRPALAHLAKTTAPVLEKLGVAPDEAIAAEMASPIAWS